MLNIKDLPKDEWVHLTIIRDSTRVTIIHGLQEEIDGELFLVTLKYDYFGKLFEKQLIRADTVHG